LDRWLINSYITVIFHHATHTVTWQARICVDGKWPYRDLGSILLSPLSYFCPKLIDLFANESRLVRKLATLSSEL